jgi:hypothetical protein
MYWVIDLEAKHDLTGIKVAIKILNKRKMKNKNMISKVLQSANKGEEVNQNPKVYQPPQHHQAVRSTGHDQ